MNDVRLMDEVGECGGDETLLGFILTCGRGVCGGGGGRSGCFSLHGIAGIGFFVIEIGLFFTSLGAGSGVAAVACCNIVTKRKGGKKVMNKQKRRKRKIAGLDLYSFFHAVHIFGCISKHHMGFHSSLFTYYFSRYVPDSLAPLSLLPRH